MSELPANLGRVGWAVTTGVTSILGGARGCVSRVEENPPAETQHVDQNDDLFKGDTDSLYTVKGEQTPENLTVHTEKYGDLKTEYNEDTGMYHMTFSPEATKKLQTEGGEIKLSFPFQTVINMSGGELFVKDENAEYKQWSLGNPAEQSQPVESKDEDTVFIVEPGQTIYARWAPGNDSAACSFIFSPTGSFDDFPFPTTVEYDSPTEAEKAGLEPVNLQEFGTYAWYPIYDENGNITEFGLDIATTNQVEEGEKNLADLKREGGTVKFSVPFEIKALNSITGTIFYIDPKTGDVIFLNTGNPVTNNYGNSKIPANSVVIIGYLPEDNNNGFSMSVSADEVNVE